MRTLSDLNVYQRLSALAEELDRIARQSRSITSETAAKTAAMSLRGMASAIYEHSISQDEALH